MGGDSMCYDIGLLVLCMLAISYVFLLVCQCVLGSLQLSSSHDVFSVCLGNGRDMHVWLLLL